jgi:hypothetical protein
MTKRDGLLVLFDLADAQGHDVAQSTMLSLFGRCRFFEK